MSLNLTVPKDSPKANERGNKNRRAKSPTITMRAHPRAKSKSPNPSFCSVLSRVKDWELGAFTPKTALADNVDVMNRSNVPFSDSDRDNMSQKLDDSDESDPARPWKPSPTGSPTRPEANKGTTAAAGAGGAAAGTATGATATGEGNTDKPAAPATSGLLKSALSTNIGTYT